MIQPLRELSFSCFLTILAAPFVGLNFASAENLKSYLHFRKPESTYAKVSLEKEGLARAGDFLDSIDDDKPKGNLTVSC